MKHVKITAFYLPGAWYQVLSRIWEEGETFVVKYGSETTETKKLDATIEIVHPGKHTAGASKSALRHEVCYELFYGIPVVR